MNVVVIGAGVIGLSAAWYLMNDGHTVTVLDSGSEDGDKCSMGNSGIIVPSHFVPLAAPGMIETGLKLLAKRGSPFRIKPALDADLARWCLLFARNCTTEHVEKCAPVLLDLHCESKRLFLELAEEWKGGFRVEQKGLMMLCRTESGLNEEAEIAMSANRMGLKADLLSSQEAAAAEPNVRIECVGAVRYVDDCHVTPRAFVSKLREELTVRGATFLWNVSVDDFGPGSNTVKTSTGSLDADVFVVAAGAWSGRMSKHLGIDLPLQPGKGMHVNIESPAQAPSCAMLLKEARVAVTPMENVVRFGGTMELGEWSGPADKVRSQVMVESVADYLPEFTASMFDLNNVWTGLRPCSPDGMPYIGRSKLTDTVVFATGHGMMGLSLGPVTGKMVADLVKDPSQETSTTLSPDRFMA